MPPLRIADNSVAGGRSVSEELLMRRSIVRSTLVAAFGTLLLASSVLAGQPTREFADFPQDLTLAAADTGCAFDVHFHLDVNREYVLTFNNPDGSVVFEYTGAFKFTLTNLSTDKSLAFNGSGILRLALDANGDPTTFRFAGPIVGFSPLVLYKGQIDVITETFHGTTIDLCAVLS
jgi:hypothetical protein